MSKRQKIIEKILAGRTVSYEEAENILLAHGFVVEIKGSHQALLTSSHTLESVAAAANRLLDKNC